MALEEGAIALIAILGIEVVAISALVTYLLLRPKSSSDGSEKEKSDLEPEGNIATTYDEPNGLLFNVKDAPIHESTSGRSSTSSDFKKVPIDEDFTVIEIDEESQLHGPSPVVIQMDQNVEEEPIVPKTVEGIPESGFKDSSSSSSSEDEKEATVIPPVEPQKSSTSESEPEESGGPPVEEKKISLSSRSSSDSDAETSVTLGPSNVVIHVDETDGRSSPEERLPEPQAAPRMARADLKRNESSSSTTSDDSKKNFVSTANLQKEAPSSDDEHKIKETSSSSSSSDDSKKNFVSTANLQKEAPSPDDEEKSKLKLVKTTDSSSPSTDVEIFNHKKKIRRKKIIHNIEEEEIIEEHEINRKHKRIIKKVAGDSSSSSTTSSSEEEKVKVKKSKKRSKKKKRPISSSSSSSSEESDKEEETSNLKSPDETTYSTQYYYDVTNKDDEKHITRTVIEKATSPTRDVIKHHVYKEVITEDKPKELEMEVDEETSSEEEKQLTMRSEKEIQIDSTPNLEVFTTTVVTNEEGEPKIEETSSSSSSSESDSEIRIRSKQDITLMSPIKNRVEEEEEEEEKEESSSSSSSSEEDVDDIKMQSHKYITLQKKKPDPPSSSSSSSDEEEKVITPKSSTSEEKEIPVNEVVAIKAAEIETHAQLDEYRESTTTVTTETIVTTTRSAKPKSRRDISFQSGWKKRVSVENLLKAGVVSETTIEDLETGKIEQAEVERSLRMYLVGNEPIAGLIMSDTGDKISIFEAWKMGLMRRGTSISLLEAQAATGRVIDPKTADRMSVNEATEKRLIDRQFEAVLVRAERAVHGYTTRSSKETLSLFEAMKKGLVVENHGIRLLEAQIATGGIIDPNANHRLPVEVAFERGLFDKRLHQILEDPSDDTRGFFDPNTEENLTYLELMDRCVIDQDTGLRLLPFRNKKSKPATKVSKIVFESASKRQVLLQDIVAAELVDLKTAQKYDEGRMTSEEVNDMVAKLKVFVDGRMPIAGVINSITGEKMSILEACRSNIIRKGTAFELIEAQAACGKIIDVQSGKAVSIETALRTGVIDSEHEEVVSRANRAIVGYREPFKRSVLSLCEAMQRHLVVERQAIRLLEAQIATGGIIDMRSPVRINVDVAIKRNLLDAKLGNRLQRRETTSYYDPMTGENMNYSELMGRCVLDKDTNLLFLLVEGGTVTQNIRPFEPEPESMKIREKLPVNLTTQVVSSKARSQTVASSSDPPVSPSAVPSSPPAILSRRVVIVDPTTDKELTVQEALDQQLIDEETAKQLLAQEGDFEEDNS